jgi:hypothetical protein
MEIAAFQVFLSFATRTKEFQNPLTMSGEPGTAHAAEGQFGYG